MDNLLPLDLYNTIFSNFGAGSVYEIRLRRNMPVTVNVGGEYKLLTSYNKTAGKFEPVYASSNDIDYVLMRATDNSIYSFNNQIKHGFVTYTGGIRIGLGGEVVVDEQNSIRTVKNIFSLVIRIPHEVQNCSLTAMAYIYDNSGVKNTLIIGPPGCGKTTILRDISKQLSKKHKIMNTLVIDERNEIAGNINGNMFLDAGIYTDVITNSSKSFGFSEGIRSLRPDIIITDELAEAKDITAAANAMCSGVKIIASCHAENLLQLREKDEFVPCLSKRLFERYVILSCKKGVGSYDAIYDESFNPLFIGN